MEIWTRGASGLSKNDWKKLSDYTGPLGTFSSKLEMAKAIGLLDKTLYTDINVIRIIRNRAAHGNSDFSLSATENTTLIASMNWNYGKKSKIRRYSLNKNTSNKVTLEKEEMTNESIAKGYGLIRYDKHNFILTMYDIKLELTKLLYISEIIGRRIPIMRSEALKAINDVVESKKDKKETN